MKRTQAALLAVLFFGALAAQAKPNINIKINDADALPGPVVVSKGDTQNGDLVVRGSVTVAGTLNGDIAVLDGEILVSGKATGDIAALDSPISVSGEVIGDLASAGGAIKITGRVLGDVAIMGGDLELGPKAILDGDAALLGGRLKKSPGAQFNGSLSQLDLGLGRRLFNLASRFQKNKSESKDEKTANYYIAGIPFLLGNWFIVVLLAALLPRQTESIASAVSADAWKCAGLGLLLTLAFAPGLILLVCSIVGILLVPLATLAFGAALLLALSALSVLFYRRLGRSWTQSVAKTPAAATGGFLALISPALLGKLLNLAGATNLGSLFVFANLILLSFGVMVVLGAVVATRFGTKPLES